MEITMNLLQLDRKNMILQSITGILTSFVSIIILFGGDLRYGDCEVLRLCWDKRRTTLSKIK
jgi:hypothetical protein